MLRFLRDRLLLVCILLAAIATVSIEVGCNNSGGGYYKNAYGEGKVAYEGGVPAEANPYRGANNYVLESRGWVDGWMHAKQLHDKQSTEK